MDSLLHIVMDMEEELGRELQIREVDFLQWVHERYKEQGEQCEKF